jgi:hypothetical protein
MVSIQKWFGVLIATAGVTLLTIPPASAAPPTVNWKAVSTNSNWHCSDYVSPSNADGLNFKSCVVVNAHDDAQGVLVVQNPTNAARTIKGAIRLPQIGGDVNCAETPLQPGFTRGCYSTTKSLGCAHYTGPVNTHLFVWDGSGWNESLDGKASEWTGYC